MIRTYSKSRNINRLLSVLGIILLLVIAGGGAFYLHNRNISRAAEVAARKSKETVKPTNTVDYTPAKPTDNSATEERKDNPAKAAPTLSNGPTTPENSPSLAITITRAGKDQSGQNLQVATLIEGATSGTCTITASKQGQKSISQQAAVQLQSNSYSCPVVNIPISSFPEKGDWTVSASVTSNGQTKSSAWAANPVSL